MRKRICRRDDKRNYGDSTGVEKGRHEKGMEIAQGKAKEVGQENTAEKAGEKR